MTSLPKVRSKYKTECSGRWECKLGPHKWNSVMSGWYGDKVLPKKIWTSLSLRKCFSTGVIVVPQGAFGNIWGHFLLSQLSMIGIQPASNGLRPGRLLSTLLICRGEKRVIPFLFLINSENPQAITKGRLMREIHDKLFWSQFYVT
jgi:hypothetical protein